MKTDLKGKAVYKPKGKAGEYAEWACNFYVGCSNGCEYCYLKKGRGAKILGGDKPTLKKCFKDEEHALEVFEKELKANLQELQKHGLFFSFTTDPMLIETISLTQYAIILCVWNKVPVKILTKTADFIFHSFFNIYMQTDIWIEHYKLSGLEARKYIAFGFTLTGHDELEPNASTNAERIEAMRKLHEADFKTFASIEPIIDFDSSFRMIQSVSDICEVLKIGLMSGKKYTTFECKDFCNRVINNSDRWNWKAKIYFKDSLLKQAGINREDLPSNCVSRDYNIFQLWKQNR